MDNLGRMIIYLNTLNTMEIIDLRGRFEDKELV